MQIDPITRAENYLSAIAGLTQNIPEPVTRAEQLLAYIAQNGGGSGLPTAPTTDGAYTLRCNVSNGTATYAWDSVTSLASISVTTPPTKTVYSALESFDATGMVVTATYSNGTTLIVSGYTVAPDPLTVGTTEVTITYTEDGVSKTATQAVTVSKAQVPVPTVSGTLTYDGTEQSPTISNEPSLTVATRGGDASAINAGSYTKTYTLIDTANCEWATSFDGNLAWGIDKAAAVMSVSPASVALNSSAPTAVASVLTNSPGALSTSTSDSSVATESVSGTTVTVSSVGSHSGTATITISQAATENFLAASATISATASFYTVYGISWDGSASLSCTRTDAAALFSDPVPYVAGASSYSSPFDDLAPWKDMVRVTDSEAGEMVKIPKFWYKLTAVGTKGVKVQIADGAADGFSVCPACMDRGDGAGERDYVLVGRYHCGAGDYKSKTGVAPLTRVTQSTFRQNCHSLGAKVWMMDFATRFTIWLLYIVEFANWDSQAKIGYGCGNGSSAQNMGYTDAMPYHTGTTQSARTTYGLGTQYRYIEGLWDNVFDRLTGAYNGTDGLYITLDPSDFAEDSGGTAVGTPAHGWTSGWSIVSDAGFPMVIPSEAVGDGSNYISDIWNFGAGSPVLCAGGEYGTQRQAYGMFCTAYSGLGVDGGDCGSRLLKLP